MARMRGGTKIVEALRVLAAKLDKPGTVRIGFLENARYPNGTPVALVAAVLDGGAPGAGIPPRPFFRNMIADHKMEWPAQIAAVLKDNNYDAEKTLGIMGANIAGRLRESIINTNEPPLSPVTVMLRGMRSQAKYKGKAFGDIIGEAVSRVAAGKTNYGASTKALIDTDHMYESVNYEVKTK